MLLNTYQSNPPTHDEAHRFSRKRAFFSALQRLPMYKVRQGRLVYRGRDARGNPYLPAKKVSISCSDLTSPLSPPSIKFNNAAVLAGDSDLMSAIEAAQAEGTSVWFVHGSANTYALELWEAADNRLSVADPALIASIQSDRQG